MKTTIKTKINYGLIKIASFVLALLPLFIFTLVKWKYIFGSEVKEKAVFTNFIGLIFLIIFIALIVLKKTKILKGIGGFWFVTLILYCFKNIDISFLYSIALWSSVGMSLSKLFDIMITSDYKDKLQSIKNAEINKEINQSNTDALISAINNINGRG